MSENDPFLSGEARVANVRAAALRTLSELEVRPAAWERQPVEVFGRDAGAFESGSHVRFAIASAALAAPTAQFGACWCGSPLQFEGHKDGSLHICCTGVDHHCFTP